MVDIDVTKEAIEMAKAGELSKPKGILLKDVLAAATLAGLTGRVHGSDVGAAVLNSMWI